MQKITSNSKVPYVGIFLQTIQKLGASQSILYAIIKDRHNLSGQNERFQDQRGIFCLFNIKELESLCHVSAKTIQNNLKELSERNRIDLTTYRGGYYKIYLCGEPDTGFEVRIPKILFSQPELKPAEMLLYGYIYSCLCSSDRSVVTKSRKYFADALGFSKNSVVKYIKNLKSHHMITEKSFFYWGKKHCSFTIFLDKTWKDPFKELILYKKIPADKPEEATVSSEKNEMIFEKNGTGTEKKGIQPEKNHRYIYHYNHYLYELLLKADNLTPLSIRKDKLKKLHVEQDCRFLINKIEKEQNGTAVTTKKLLTFLLTVLTNVPDGHIRCGNEFLPSLHMEEMVQKALEQKSFLLYLLKKTANLIVTTTVRKPFEYLRTAVYGWTEEFLKICEAQKNPAIRPSELLQGTNGNIINQVFSVYNSQAFLEIIS